MTETLTPEDGEHCQDCGRTYGLMGWWRAEDDLWFAVTDRRYGGLFCPDCFGRRAQEKGIPLRWTAERDEPAQIVRRRK